MSILIKGMEAPKSCRQCIFLNMVSDYVHEYDCPFNNKVGCNDFEKIPKNKRHKYCPLVEVPTPHGDLIDSDDVIDEINRVTFVSQYDYNTAYNIVEQADAVIEAEE